MRSVRCAFRSRFIPPPGTLAGVTNPARPRLGAARGVLSLMLVALVAIGLLGMHALSGVPLPTMPASARGPVIAHAAVSVSPHQAVAGTPEQVAPEAQPVAPHGGRPLAVCPADVDGDGMMCLPGPVVSSAAAAAEPPVTALWRIAAIDHAAAPPLRDSRRFALSPLELSISRT